MVRSMMSRATLSISFWGYALETAVHILDLVPTKKVYVRQEAQDKLEARSKKCLFVSYPEESFGYLFYKLKDNVVFVARRGVFLEREMISKEDSGSKIELEKIQESADEEPIVNTDTQQEVVTPVKPDGISLPIRKTSGRVSKPTQFHYGFHIEEDKISDCTLSKLDEPTNYKEAMASPEAAKWKEAMKSKIQSMYDNQVWNLVDTTPGLKTMGCKWIFKKKTDMDGKVHTYKARLVAKGYTQTQGIDYEETFSPVAKIKSIRIMLAIAAFHDYEICGSVVVFLVLYVDDILLMGNDIPMSHSVKYWLGKCFAMKDLGDAAYILVIMEYLVNISKRRAFWSLNEDILKITILKTNTPSRKIWRIRACTHQRPQWNEAQYVEFLEELQVNAYHGWIDEDVINHIAMVLKMIDSIYIPGVNSHQTFRMENLPLSLAVEENKCSDKRRGGKVHPFGKKLIEKFFCKFYPESYDGEEEMFGRRRLLGYLLHSIIFSRVNIVI
ncbi:retrotransposon protein, putative, ty1-copia subclass [Tanacetum coccineum]